MPRWKPDAEERLAKEAFALFVEQGYDETTVAQIADRAGLTERTFFRYFSDKREVLFDGSAALERACVDGIRRAPATGEPLDTVAAGLDAIAQFFDGRHAFARMRSTLVESHSELQERELIKLQHMSAAITAVLRERGVPDPAAALAAQSGITVFHVAFARWVLQDDPAALRRLIDETLSELRRIATPDRRRPNADATA